LISALNVGGTERQLVELVRGLAGTPWRSEVVVFRKTGALLGEMRALDVEPRALSLGGTLRRAGTALVMGRLASWLRGASLLHCHDAYAVMVGVPAARLAGVPVLAARRDLGHHLSAPQRLVLRGALALATRVLANAATVAAQAARDDGVPASRLVVVPNGVDLDGFDARAVRVEEPVPAELGVAPTVLMVGRMIHHVKGHDVFLRAAALVHREQPEVRFLIAGDGERERELRALARALGIVDRVRFLGRRADVPALLARADLICHPARAEGLPNAVLEAMAAGRPLVATTAGGTPELVRDGVDGLLVPPDDAPALAGALLALLADPSRARFGHSARRRVEEELTLEHLAARTQRVYQEMVGAGARTPSPPTA
jgi:glycosyltransferase involved in cell wall biosynthesis